MKKSYYQILTKPILFVGVLLLIAGAFSLSKMKTNLFPEVQFPRVAVVIDAGQLPVDRMMITVTKPVESAVKKVQGVTIVKSNTSRGSAVIDIFMDWGTDTYQKKLEIESRINEIRSFFPVDVITTVEAVNQSTFPVFGFTLEHDGNDQIALKDQANLVVRPLLSQVKGMANVVIKGGRSKEYVIIPKADRMAQMQIGPQAIIDAFNNTNFVASDGQIAHSNRIYLTLTDTRVQGVDDLMDTPIVKRGIEVVCLKDIATVRVKPSEEFTEVNANGHKALIIDLIKQPGINLLDFAQEVEAKSEEVAKQLPSGFHLKPYYNQSAFVNDSISSVMETIYEGLLLAIIVMFFFLRSWRASLVVLLTIPVTVAFTFLVLYLVGISINIMSLGAIAASVGLIIDDAIVIIEQIYRTHEEHPNHSRYRVVSKSIKMLFPAMIASSLATIVIHFPFRLMSGLAGSFFKELSDTMQITMVVSFLVTWLLLPVLHLVIGYHAKVSVHKRGQEEKEHQLDWLTNIFKYPVLALSFVVLLLGGAWYSYGHVSQGFLPDLDEGSIVLDYYSPPGTSVQETDRLCRQMETIIMSNDQIATYSRRTGMKMSIRTVPPNFGDYSIQLKSGHEKTTEEVINELRRDISLSVPILKISFGQRIADLLGDLMSTSEPVEVKIFGDNYADLKDYAQKVEHVLQGVDGVVDIDNGLVTAGPSFLFIPNQDRLAEYGLTPLQFQNQLQSLVEGLAVGIHADIPTPSPTQVAIASGLQIGQIQDGEQMRKILLRNTDYSSNSLDRVLDSPIYLSNGSYRTVSYFSKVEVISGEMEQQREDLKSVIRVTARLDGRDLGSVMSEIRYQVAQNVMLPKGYQIVYGGAYKEQQQSFKELTQILVFAVLLVFTVLLFLFRRWTLSLLIILISMLGICGSLIALWTFAIPLNVSSYTGIIMIVGIIAENAIFTAYQYQANLKQNNSVSHAIHYAIALRIRPKLMTAIGAILALMPLALGVGLGAQMQQPLAVAVIGGFVVGLPLLLWVFPSFLESLDRNRKDFNH
ncbi:efflux RND transporter permease subunit [Halosquirtibacter xylanolyticus]|uniref:efflux RND transporter permease subunit n=1 Tax=Halosquirtibacter xylanolyticus TaxID=3374599 RepID=UPI003749886A|nr:efflux RND transporter permease subunit [Prolixibacteraceae bacterium]